MIVVADTTPLNYLVLIDQIDLLPLLYQRVYVPHEVLRELQNPRAPQAVRSWASQLPSWCEAYSPAFRNDPGLDNLGAGERDAIKLALERGIETVLIDERAGRYEAELRNLKVTGTLTVLELAGRRGIIEFREMLRKLEQTSFRLSDEIRAQFLRRNP